MDKRPDQSSLYPEHPNVPQCPQPEAYPIKGIDRTACPGGISLPSPRESGGALEVEGERFIPPHISLLLPAWQQQESSWWTQSTAIPEHCHRVYLQGVLSWKSLGSQISPPCSKSGILGQRSPVLPSPLALPGGWACPSPGPSLAQGKLPHGSHAGTVFFLHVPLPAPIPALQPLPCLPR